MIKTIVTGVDGSDTAANAARKAAELAIALGAELHVLSAYGKFEVETFSSGDEEFVVTSEGSACKIVDTALGALRRDYPGLAISSEAAEGKPAAALVRAAERLGADLIVVGNKRAQGLAKVLGSIALDVTGHASCDVYVAYTHER